MMSCTSPLPSRWVLLLCLQSLALASAGPVPGTCKASGDGSCSADAVNEEALLKRGFELVANKDEAGGVRIFEKVLKTNPKSANALFQLGYRGLTNPDDRLQSLAVKRLMQAFEPDAVPQPISHHSPPGQWVAKMIGRRFAQRKEFGPGQKYLEKAAFSQAARGQCQLAQWSTLIPTYPYSVKHAAQAMENYHTRMQNLLDMPNVSPMKLREDGEDMYVFCLLSAFDHSFYYESDARSAVSKHFKVTARLLPDLIYTAPYLHSGSASQLPPRIRLGVASGFFTHGSSVLEDFGGVFERLPRERFDITIIYLNEANNPDFAKVMMTHFKNDASLVFNNHPGWLDEARSKVEALELDLLLYLDLTMSTMCQRLGMSKLAHVQSTSHGHPISSGIDRSIMNYYVSWAASELPTAQDHYTEELALLPAETMHQYYAPRSKDGRSAVDGQSFENLIRADFPVPADGHWYLCMQKPFKRHPVFDKMLADVLAADKEARIILHDVEGKHNKKVFSKRFEKLNIDMKRVHFLPPQPHHRLLALYRLSDVILDTYYASGCTTTREAMELGALVVTLPAKYLGSRWSLAYFSIIGVLDLVAKDEEDYVRLAVHLASDVAARAVIQQRIRDNLHKMYYRTEAVDAWANLLLKIASEGRASAKSASTWTGSSLSMGWR